VVLAGKYKITAGAIQKNSFLMGVDFSQDGLLLELVPIDQPQFPEPGIEIPIVRRKDDVNHQKPNAGHSAYPCQGFGFLADFFPPMMQKITYLSPSFSNFPYLAPGMVLNK
jgi:hypothetical protein